MVDYESEGRARSNFFVAATGLGLVVLPLVGVIFVAIGVSGVLAAVLGATLGHEYVVELLREVAVTPERCVELMRLEPEAASCAAALSEHKYEELISFRFLAGVLGALMIVVHFFITRKWTRAGNHPVREVGTGPALGLGAFAAATLLMALIAFASGNFSGNNAPGEWLSATAVSAAFSIAYFILLVRNLRDIGVV